MEKLYRKIGIEMENTNPKRDLKQNRNVLIALLNIVNLT